MERDDAAEEDNGNRFALLGLGDDDHDDDHEESEEGGHGHGDATGDGDNGTLRQHSQQGGSATGPTAAAVGATGVTAAAAAAVGEALVGVGRRLSPPEEVEEDHMGNDPYNPNDWKKFAVDEGEVG